MEQKRYSGVFVKCKNKFLSCKRNSDMPFPGVWSIPGGKIEENESSLDAAKREFYEETNIDISEDNLVFIGVLPRTNREGDKIKGYMYTYLLEVDKEIYPDLELASDGEEHTECKYFTLEDINDIDIDEYLEKLVYITLSK